MRRWDSRCDEIADNMKQYGDEARRAHLNGQDDLAEEFDAKCTAELGRLNDYRGTPGPRSLVELARQVLAYLQHLRGA